MVKEVEGLLNLMALGVLTRFIVHRSKHTIDLTSRHGMSGRR